MSEEESENITSTETLMKEMKSTELEVAQHD